MFTVCVGLVLDSKYVQFRIISSLLGMIIVDTFEVNGKPLLNSTRNTFSQPINTL